jgi:hypothetical protein
MFEVDSKSASRNWGSKVLVSSVVAFLLSLGLCGLGAVTGSGEFSTFMFVAGVVVLGLSLLGIIVGIVWTAIDASR